MIIFQALNWLLRSVTQLTCLHDLLWHFVAALAPLPMDKDDEDDDKANKEDKDRREQEQVGME